jgi:hypothetical protein
MKQSLSQKESQSRMSARVRRTVPRIKSEARYIVSPHMSVREKNDQKTILTLAHSSITLAPLPLDLPLKEAHLNCTLLPLRI